MQTRTVPNACEDIGYVGTEVHAGMRDAQIVNGAPTDPDEVGRQAA